MPIEVSALNNPFAVLTAVVAPAVLTNASSVLCLGTGNRIARVVDRTRVVAAGMAGLQVGSKEYQAGADQLARLQLRAQLLFRALRILYASLGLFAATALITVIGSSLEFFGWQFGFRVTAFIAMGSGTAAVIGLGYGCALMVRETRVAVQNLALEAELVRSQYASPRS
jgi:X-X-X-Leu-X-X-Gly heptad repeat protein